MRGNKSMNVRVAFAVCLLAAAGSAQADAFDISIHEHALRAIYSSESPTRGSQFEVGYLYNEEHEDMAHIGLHVSGQNWSEKGTFGISLGGRLIGISTDVGDVAAIGLGGRVRFSPAHRIGVVGQAYYAPSIASFLDGENFVEAGVQLDYQLLPNAFVYVGYRFIEVDLETVGEVTIEDNAHVGMKLLF